MKQEIIKFLFGFKNFLEYNFNVRIYDRNRNLLFLINFFFITLENN